MSVIALILSHHPDCIQVGTKKVKGTSAGNRDGEITQTDARSWKNTSKEGIARTDYGKEETVESWQCHTDCPVRIMDEQSGISESKSGDPNRGSYKKAMFANSEFNKVGAEYDDIGGASRFFYCAKASQQERNYGLKKFELKENPNSTYGINTDKGLIQRGRNPENCASRAIANNHPTVKPVALMRYLVRLITPKDSICLDPFNGSGTTGVACKLEYVNYVGMEREKEYCDISEARIKAWDESYYTIEYAAAKEYEKQECMGQLGLF